jgi:EpsI family protein
MKPSSYRAYLPAVVLCAGCAFLLRARTQDAVPLRAPLSGILPQLAGYSVQDQTISPEERRVAGMTAYVARMYSRNSTPAFTTFVSYYDRQAQGQTIHSPRNCLPGAGWEVISAGTTDVTVDGTSRTVNKYLLKNQNSMAMVFYWYQGRGRLVANEYAVKLNLLRDAAFTRHTEEALVRVVVPISDSATSSGNAVPAAGEREQYAEATSLGQEISARLAHEVALVLPES